MPDDRIARLRLKAMRLPLSPGVYLMKDSSHNIIYIGKAKKLKNRVSSYFGSDKNHSPKVRSMVSHVEDFDYVVVDSEFEALVLECSLIKQHSPKYNILLKDDKGYSYIRVTPYPWRTVSAVHRMEEDGARYIGPFTGNWSIFGAVDEAREIFSLPDCGKSFPKDINPRGRPCLNYFIKKCSAPCCAKISLEDYESSVSDALDFLSGDKTSAVEDLKRRMERCAEELDFETAALLRDRLRAIERLGAKQKVVSLSERNRDVFALAPAADKSCLAVLRFRDGLLADSEHFLLPALSNPSSDDETEDVYQSLIAEFYSIRDYIPPEILVDRLPDGTPELERFLTEKAGRNVRIRVPERGDGRQLMEMCRSNAYEQLTDPDRRRNPALAAAQELAGLLGLASPPLYIESYDISHTAGSDAVGGMIVFRDGKPLRSAYRRFIISAENSGDDYGSLNEVLTRRFNEYDRAREAGEEDGFGRLPDLILLDGGEGQVGAVRRLFDERGITVPLYGLVKDGKHRTRAIASSGGEISIADKRRCFTLVSEIQEEVHRYSIAYHRKKHTKTGMSSVLTNIPGVGPKRAKALLTALGSLDAIKTASEEELAAVPGVGEAAAKKIYGYLHEEQA